PGPDVAGAVVRAVLQAPLRAPLGEAAGGGRRTVAGGRVGGLCLSANTGTAAGRSTGGRTPGRAVRDAFRAVRSAFRIDRSPASRSGVSRSPGRYAERSALVVRRSGQTKDARRARGRQALDLRGAGKGRPASACAAGCAECRTSHRAEEESGASPTLRR